MPTSANNLTLRLLTALIGAPLVILAIVVHWSTTAVLLIIAVLIGALEYRAMIQQRPHTWRAYAFGAVYLGLPLIAGLWLRSIDDGAYWLLLTLVTNWLTDTGAYIAGRTMGNTPLAPELSPQKTWEGAAGGVLVGFLAATISTALIGRQVSLAVLLVGLVNPIVTIIGDLVESGIKRHYGVKDSGVLLPGHGGILDRIDGTLFAMVAVAGIVWLTT